MYTPWDVLRSGVLYFLFDVSSQVYHWKPRYLPWCQLCRYWWYRRLLRKPTIQGLRCHQWRQSWYHDDSLLVAMMHNFSHKWYRRLSLWQTSLVTTKLASRRHSVSLYITTGILPTDWRCLGRYKDGGELCRGFLDLPILEAHRWFRHRVGV